jgi:hypothetical protein
MLHALLLASAVLLALVPDLGDGSALAKQVAAEYAQQTTGTVSFVVQTHSEVKAVHHVEDSEAAYVYVNGAPVHKRYLKSVVGNKAASTDALSKLSAEPEGALSRFELKMPITTALVANFSYAKPREVGDLIAVDFTTKIKDPSCGDGTFYVRKNGVLDRVHFVPSIMPEHATALTVDVEYGSVGAERWDVVKIVRSFIGHRGALSGRVTSTSTYVEYHLYPSETAAITAIDALPLAAR